MRLGGPGEGNLQAAHSKVSGVAATAACDRQQTLAYSPESIADLRRRASLLAEVRRLIHAGIATGCDLAAVLSAWKLAAESLSYFALREAASTSEWFASTVPPWWGLVALWLLWRLASRQRGEVNPVFGARAAAVVLAALTLGIFALLGRAMGVEISGAFVGLFGAMSYGLFVVCGALGERLSAVLLERAPAADYVAIVGDPTAIGPVLERVKRYRGREVHLIGVVLPKGYSGAEGLTVSGMNVLGEISDLAKLINQEQLTRVIVVDQSLCPEEAEFVRRTATRMGVVTSHVLEPLKPRREARWEVGSHCGLAVVNLRPVEFGRSAGERVKRVFDVVCASLALVLLSPLMLLIGLLIRLTSEGPIFHLAPRVGKGGRYFTFYKFRTMYANQCSREHVKELNEKDGHIFKIRNDPRVTPLGRLLRRFSLDELPQLINVLKGDMSLVGPRPLPACDLDPDGMSRDFRHWAETRAKVLPGITGLWQVRGRSELSFEQMMDLDIEYVENWSFWLDLQILLVTPIVVLLGRGAH